MNIMKIIKPIRVGIKIGYRYFVRSKTKLVLKSIEILDDNISTEIISYLKYNNISDDSINSYYYILFYECLYLGIVLNIKEKKEHKELIVSSIQNIIIYYLMKIVVLNPIMNTYNYYIN